MINSVGKMLSYDVKDLPTHNFGLYNTGTICYFNALLQSLFSCPQFNKVAKKQTPLIAALLNDTLQVRNSSSLLVELMRAKKNTFGQNQECADEALKLLIEFLGVTNLFEIKYEVFIFCYGCKKTVSNVFDYLAHTGLPKSISTEKIERYILQHKIDIEDYFCAYCNKKSKASVEYILRRLSEIIIIVLDKYDGKYAQHIPSQLNFPGKKKTQLVYSLVAIIDHFGNASGGHYTATCLRNREIITFNDTQFCKTAFVASPNIYIAFYSFTRTVSVLD